MTQRSITDSFKAILSGIGEGRILLTLPGTSYELDLALADSRQEIDVSPGKRVRGVINGQALRMHEASAGGRFIEPAAGTPRIVQGTIIDSDVQGNRLLVDIIVPMWMSLEPGQDATEFELGGLVNFYVDSNISFTPVGPDYDHGNSAPIQPE